MPLTGPYATKEEADAACGSSSGSSGESSGSSVSSLTSSSSGGGDSPVPCPSGGFVPIKLYLTWNGFVNCEAPGWGSGSATLTWNGTLWIGIDVTMGIEWYLETGTGGNDFNLSNNSGGECIGGADVSSCDPFLLEVTLGIVCCGGVPFGFMEAVVTE